MRDINFDLQPEFIEQQYGETAPAQTFVNPQTIDEIPPSTEAVAGKIQVATQGETNAGTNDSHAVTPEKLANSVWAKRKFSVTFGDGVLTQFDFIHNFNTRDVQVEVRKDSGDYETVTTNITVKRPTVNAVRLNFTVAPTASELRVIIIS